jgi:hypothetical protein
MRIKCVSSFVLTLAALATILSPAANAAPATLVPAGSSHKYFIGVSEASTPDNSAWRNIGFDDSSWSTGTAPIGYSDGTATSGPEASIVTTLRESDSAPNWLSVYLRKTFTITSLSNVSSVTLNLWVDDGAAAWINGVEAGRINLPAGPLAFNCCTPAIAAEETRQMTVTITDLSHLVVGENILTIQSFNANTTSSDFVIEAELTATEDTEPPFLVNFFPPANSTNGSLITVEVLFNEAVTGVTAGDLLINNVPASSVVLGEPNEYIFSFPQPNTGTVSIAWAMGHGITDLIGNAFAGGSWTVVLDPSVGASGLLINEFMTSNDETLNDEDGDSSDWIEIHNPGSIVADLSGYFLTDRADLLTQWQFPPGAAIGPNGYLVVFASGKNRPPNPSPTGRLHTNFELGPGGEYLALLDRNTNVVSEFAPYPGGQQTDVSYGRDAGDPGITGFFTTPTPGARNQVSGSGFSSEVLFSRKSGTFPLTSPFSLILTTAVANAQIRYAFGTNMPTATSTLYTGPIPITNTTLIRVRTFAPSLLPGPISTRSYVALDASVLNVNSHLPIMILHNYGVGPIPDNDKTDKRMLMQTFEPGFGNASMTNEPNLAEFGIYHTRGSSTINYAKESWFMEIQDEFRDGKPVPMMGLPAESDWVWYAPNNFEPSLMHNPLAMQLARDQGEYASRTRFVEVYYKDDAGNPGAITASDYNGIYVLMEKIKRDPNRVNINQLENEHTRLPEVSGGYAFSIDRGNDAPPLSAGGATMNWIYPQGWLFTNSQSIRTNQLIYIRNYFNSFNSALNNGTIWTNPTTGYAAYIDVNSWVRRHVHEVLTFNVDALRLSGYFYKDRNKKIEYGPAWDYDRTQGSTDGRDFNPRTFRSQVPDLGTDFFNFNPWWARLFQAPDFWQAWIDKYEEMRKGPLDRQHIWNRIDEFYNELVPAYPRERARWNVPTRSVTGSGSGTFETEVQFKKNWYSNRLDFIDGQLLAAPTLSAAGGLVTNGAQVTISPAAKPGSMVVYTLNGTDPRASGGSFALGALSNAGPVTVTISNNVRIFARSWNVGHSNVTGANNPPISSRWSGTAVGSFYTALPALRITEIMYHPAPATSGTFGEEEFEYIEFRNISGANLNVQGYRIKGGVDFTFPSLVLTPGQRTMVVRNRAAFQQRYGAGLAIAGEYTNVLSVIDGTRSTNSLNNGGDHLVLEGRLGEPIHDFDYDDDWYPSTDGFGFSLVIVNDQADPATWGLKESWRPSGEINGSPGQPGTEQTFPLVVINEVLTHSDPAPPTDTIELLNLSGASADISGWFLTDDFRVPKKYRIPNGTTIAANGYITFDESQFNVGSNSFSLSSLGEEVYLFSGDGTNVTGYADGFDFGAAENGRTFGRYAISTGTHQYPRQASATLGAANSGPIVGPIVISEINYRPTDLVFGGRYYDNDIEEYIELRNITGAVVPLYDPSNPQNTWRLRDAVDFDFPTNTSIAANGFILVVNFNPANAQKLEAFRAQNGVSPSVPIFGPYQGKLDNAGEAIELQFPDNPEPPGPPNFGRVPYVLAERVRYSDQAPWPAGADGIGPTLQRINLSAYGNDPANWIAAARTPGAIFGGGTPPTVTQDPTNQTVLAGNPITLSVGATGANLSYQWRFNQQILSGATSSTLTIPNSNPSHEGTYDVAVMNPSGAILSGEAFVTVLIPIVLTFQPTNSPVFLGSTNIANLGADAKMAGNPSISNATFTVGAVSTRPISYQWYKNGVLLPGYIGPSLVVSNIHVNDNGTTYQCIAADSVSSAVSAEAVLRAAIVPFVTTPYPEFATNRHPQPIVALVGENVTFGVVHSGSPPFGYRWRLNSQPLTATNGGVIYSPFWTVPNVQTSATVRTYTVVVTNLGNPAPGLLCPPGGIGAPPAATLTVLADTDGDKAPDTWETQFGFNPADGSDGGTDFDGDGMSNANEWRAGTDPKNASSYLRVDQIDVTGSTLLTFGALSNKSYSVEFRDSLDAGAWSRLTHVSSATSNRTVTVLDTNVVLRRYYRLGTPLPQN